ncbi:MAG TPA: APC family permease [Thermoleophilia bacterium]|nr:APC family permease [Acidobacteriota bacterium]NLT92515.1 APC family permease [Actinomycetota bacterium]HOU28144.1 APC family permease [Thermoleophilia bacterium]HQF52514.1 APC family permease [Thermoleophilia bacterium]
MAEELAFARKASGLVRGLSMWDAFGVGFMNQGLTPSIVVMTSLGVGVYTGGNMIIAVVLSVILAGIGMPIVWGVLGGSMPRSGGEYIYNTRILHPIIGIAESFGNAFVWIMWIYVLAPWVADPGFTMLASFTGWQSLADWATQPYATFILASIANVVAFCFVVFGIKIFARVQKVIMTIGIGGCAILCVVLSVKAGGFQEAWNSMAAQHGSLDYTSFIAAVEKYAGEAMPTTWNWFDSLGVMVAASWAFAYAYCMAFIAGEVKRPDKTIILANLFAVVVPGIFCLWTAIALYQVDFNFLSAAFYADNLENYAWTIEGYKLPFSSNYVGLGFIMAPYKLLGIIYALSYMAFALWWVALSYLAFPRIIFAWGMDRMGPKWFTDINPRFASPVKNHILCLILGEIGIALYVFWTNSPLQGLAVTGLEVVTVFGVTAIAALVFPYRKRARGVWESSPYRNWRLFGIPVVTLGAIVDLIYLGILFVFFFVMPDLRDFTTTGVVFFACIWLAGIVWYFIWKQRSKTVGVDVSMTYGELPPE